MRLRIHISFGGVLLIGAIALFAAHSCTSRAPQDAAEVR